MFVTALQCYTQYAKRINHCSKNKSISDLMLLRLTTFLQHLKQQHYMETSVNFPGLLHKGEINL